MTFLILYFVAGFISSFILTVWCIIEEKVFRIEHLTSFLLGIIGGYITLIIMIIVITDNYGRATLFDWRKK